MAGRLDGAPAHQRREPPLRIMRATTEGLPDAARCGGKAPRDIAAELYETRNSMAHGKSEPLLHDFARRWRDAGPDLPIV